MMYLGVLFKKNLGKKSIISERASMRNFRRASPVNRRAVYDLLRFHVSCAEPEVSKWTSISQQENERVAVDMALLRENWGSLRFRNNTNTIKEEIPKVPYCN